MSADSKHTPGPWAYSAGATRYVVSTNYGGRSHNIASIGTTLTQQEENARLIAAAPDLLRALQLVARQHEGHLFNLGATRCECDVCETARTAIAKAEGR